jgi:hypothetical protein
VLLSAEEWGTYFHRFAHSAWRLEVQPTYTMPNEQPSIALFREGKPKPAGHNARWHETVRKNVAERRTIGRVRVVRMPLTEYQRYQLAWGIPGNIEAGEDILGKTVLPDVPALHGGRGRTVPRWPHERKGLGRTAAEAESNGTQVSSTAR